MLKQIKKYFVLWQNSTALQVFEAATKADAMKAARLYRRQWEIDDDKPVKALNEAEAAAYEAKRQPQNNNGKEEQTMKKAPAANFVKTNQHQRKNDCIFCAMANALPVTYDEAREILARSACCVKAEIQRLRNIKKALCEMGLNVTKLETRVQFAKFAAEHADPNTNYIVIACDHAAAVVNGKLLDEWDSSRKFVQYVFEITKEAYNQIKAEYRKEETTMKTTNQPTTIEATAAIIPEVLPPEQPTAAVIPAPLQEKPNNLPGALLDLDERTLQLLKMQANLAAALPGVKSLQLVGRWLWLEFTGKPTEEIRQQLKDNRWSWAPKKGKWTYHNPEEPRPGKHRYMSFEEIESKHGSAAII